MCTAIPAGVGSSRLHTARVCLLVLDFTFLVAPREGERPSRDRRLIVGQRRELSLGRSGPGGAREGPLSQGRR